MSTKEQKNRRREYYRELAGRESLVVWHCAPLGYRLLNGDGIAGQPQAQETLRAVVEKVKLWYGEYSQWRAAQGRPLRGEYGQLPPTDNARLRIIRAAKEVGYRAAQQNRDSFASALRDLMDASRQFATEERARQAQSRAAAKGKPDG